jgi:hypothetical protein
MENKIIKAIQKINPTAEVSVSGNDINTIVWENGTTPIPVADIEAQFPAVELEMAMADLRQKRNAALANSDWSVLTDVPLNPAMRSAWMNYRTLLRNLTNGLTTVKEAQAVTLPLPPK